MALATLVVASSGSMGDENGVDGLGAMVVKRSELFAGGMDEDEMKMENGKIFGMSEMTSPFPGARAKKIRSWIQKDPDPANSSDDLDLAGAERGEGQPFWRNFGGSTSTASKNPNPKSQVLHHVRPLPSPTYQGRHLPPGG